MQYINTTPLHMIIMILSEYTEYLQNTSNNTCTSIRLGMPQVDGLSLALNLHFTAPTYLWNEWRVLYRK